MGGVLRSSQRKVNILDDLLIRGAAGVLCAAHPSQRKVPPMCVVGSVGVPLPLTADSRDHNVVVRVAKNLPWCLTSGADYFDPVTVV